MMRTEKLYVRGNLHAQHNEDALAIFEVGNCTKLVAVMDGCSSAKESYFASALLAKLIKKAIQHVQNLSNGTSLDLCAYSSAELGDVILGQVYSELTTVSKQLHLDTEEILTTLLMAVYQKDKDQLWISVSGDGIFGVNDEVTVIDQQNVPDFMGYHIGHLTYEQWRKGHTQTFEFSNVDRFFLSTDGLEKIRCHHNAELTNESIRSALISPTHLSLEEQYLEFMSAYSCLALDDIAMVLVTAN